MSPQTIDDRSILLLGEDNFNKLSSFKVAVIGLGGVGSICPLALIRSGLKKFIIVDGDEVTPSNINRQIGYTTSDIGRKKVDALKEKMLEIRKAEIETFASFIDKDFNLNVFNDCDYILDCIDDINAKVELIKYATENNIKIISALGMGNKLDPEHIHITKINKTTIDPLAKKLRYLLRKNDVDLSNVLVAFSDEIPIIKNTTISSMAFVPNACGLIISSYVLRTLLQLGGN